MLEQRAHTVARVVAQVHQQAEARRELERRDREAGLQLGHQDRVVVGAVPAVDLAEPAGGRGREHPREQRLVEAAALPVAVHHAVDHVVAERGLLLSPVRADDLVAGPQQDAVRERRRQGGLEIGGVGALVLGHRGAHVERRRAIAGAVPQRLVVLLPGRDVDRLERDAVAQRAGQVSVGGRREACAAGVGRRSVGHGAS